MNPRVLIDASNLRVGGGVQVAASFLDELAKASLDEVALGRFPWLRSLHVDVSPLVHRNMIEPARGWTTRVVDRTWRSARPTRQGKALYDVEFNLFGPIYAGRRGTVRITGFADGTSLTPQIPTRHLFDARRLRYHARKTYSRAYFRHGADHVVVEAEHVRRSLLDLWGLDPHKVHVVPNSVNGVFYEPAAWLPAALGDANGALRVCYITRAYPHKNIALLGEVGQLLRSQYGLDVEFILTLTPVEWESQNINVREFSTNLGPIDVAQAPTVYQGCHAAIFPSLLESFSVTPLEALVMGCPLVASDRPFVSEVVGDAAEYFDPLSAEDATRALARVLTDPARRRELLEHGDERATTFQGPQRRAEEYLELIQRCLEASSR